MIHYCDTNTDIVKYVSGKGCSEYRCGWSNMCKRGTKQKLKTWDRRLVKTNKLY